MQCLHVTALPEGQWGGPLWADCATDVGAETAHEAGTRSALYTMPNLRCSLSSTLLMNCLGVFHAIHIFKLSGVQGLFTDWI